MCVYRESLLIQPYVWYKPQRCSRVADRFFISVFSAFRKEILESSGSHRMENGKLNVAQLYCCGHGDASVFGNAPAARVRDLCNESVSVAAVENARGFGTPTFRIGDAVQVTGVFEYVPDVLADRSNTLRKVKTTSREVPCLRRERTRRLEDERCTWSGWEYPSSGQDPVRLRNLCFSLQGNHRRAGSGVPTSRQCRCARRDSAALHPARS